MFDSSSRALLRQASDLPGLDPEALDELLTAAHIELSSVVSGASPGASWPRLILWGRISDKSDKYSTCIIYS